jgi:AcrR family transcriptional regulator
MTKPKRPTADTRERILEAACRLFAENGYRNTTMAMICRSSGTNNAAANYHFGSKESLYRSAWRHAHDQSVLAITPDGGAAPDQSPEVRLQARIRASLQRVMFSDAVAFRIMRQEIASPTGLLQEVIEEAIRPMRQATQAILRELLGPHATQRDVQFCEVCVVAPCLHIGQSLQAHKYDGLAPVFDRTMLDQISEHFVAFALAGIAETRARIEHRKVSG